MSKYDQCEALGHFEPEDFIDELARQNSLMVKDLPNVGLLNIMPSKVSLKTEHQWRDSLSDVANIVPVRFDNDPRDNLSISSRANALAISDAATSIDGLIVTGANLERHADGTEIKYEDIKYYRQLNEVIDWSVAENRLTIFSCLASHIALKSLFDINRQILPRKVFGVFEHEYDNSSWIAKGVYSDKILSPHSRWGDTKSSDLEKTGVTVTAQSDRAGWLLAEANLYGNRAIFLQGHPEYQRDDLKSEYLRDNGTADLPENYFPNDNPNSLPNYVWAEDSVRILGSIASCNVYDRMLEYK